MSEFTLDTKRVRELRAAAHSLHPVVIIGERGLSAAVLAEIDHNLSAHQLIKVRAASAERSEREAMLQQICSELNCAPVHHLGRVLIIYRALAQTNSDLPPTRATRSGSQPYVSKKRLAASAPAAKGAGGPGGATKTGPKRSLRGAAAAGAPGIPRRRPGSAFSLRAGRGRRG